MNEEKQIIDLQAILKKLWGHKILYVKTLPIVLIATYLVTICIPRHYTCSIELAPESNGSSTGNAISSLASSFGLDGLGKLGQGQDAISPLLYPDLLKSPNFIVTLFPIEVKTKDGKIQAHYYDYIKSYQKVPFWEKYIFGPIQNLFKEKVANTPYKSNEKINIRNLAKDQQDVVNAIKGNITCSIDKKTDAINITVKDQDPNVCATLGDSVLGRMQSFIIDYRTKKARNDYNYFKKLRDEAKAKYERARQNYAYMSDSNTEVTLRSVSSKIDDMENEMQLLYNAYSALATQAQVAQTKIQENTPAFTAITTAMTPIKPAGPKRMLISIFVTFLAFIGTSIYILTQANNKGNK